MKSGDSNTPPTNPRIFSSKLILGSCQEVLIFASRAGFEHVAPRTIVIDGPRAYQRLVQEIFGMPVGEAILPGIALSCDH